MRHARRPIPAARRRRRGQGAARLSPRSFQVVSPESFRVTVALPQKSMVATPDTEAVSSFVAQTLTSPAPLTDSVADLLARFSPRIAAAGDPHLEGLGRPGDLRAADAGDVDLQLVGLELVEAHRAGAGDPHLELLHRSGSAATTSAAPLISIRFSSRARDRDHELLAAPELPRARRADAKHAVFDIEPGGSWASSSPSMKTLSSPPWTSLKRRRTRDHQGVERPGRVPAALDALRARSPPPARAGRRAHSLAASEPARSAHSESALSCFETSRLAVTCVPSRRRSDELRAFVRRHRLDEVEVDDARAVHLEKAAGDRAARRSS